MVTTTIRLRFDGRSTAYQRSLRSQWRNAGRWPASRWRVYRSSPQCSCQIVKVKVKVKVHTLDIAPLRSESPPQKRSGMACVLKGSHSFTCTPTGSSAIGMSHTCHCLPTSKPKLVLIYRPRRDGRLSRPRCEVAQTEIRTRNLPIANPALYHTATSALVC